MSINEQLTEPTNPLPTPYPDLTPRQRFLTRSLTTLANDLDTGTVEEQHTAALLRLCVDATARGYAGELVAAMREWAWGMGR